MVSALIGVLLLVAWGVLQFAVQSTSGYIHLLLATGVILIIRGVALSNIGVGKTS